MCREVFALLRLRMAIILANKSLLTQLFLPILLIALYQFMFNREGDKGLLVMMLGLLIVHSMNGQLISLIMAEEQEKHNLRSLQLIGVRSWQYLLANACLPVLITVLYMVGLPLVFSVDLTGRWLIYLVVNGLTALVMLVLYMLIGVMCDTQSKATVSGLPIMLMGMLLPMLSLTDTSITKIAQYTFMSAYVAWFKAMGDLSVTDDSVWISFVWLLGLVICALVVLKKRRLHT